MTLNEGLEYLSKIGLQPSKIASGYFVPPSPYAPNSPPYLLCRCDGNSQMSEIHCGGCGAKAYVCSACLESRRIEACFECTNLYKKRRRSLEKETGRSWEEIASLLANMGGQLREPIDFEKLIADGKLERLSGTEFKLLVPYRELPAFVLNRIIGIETHEVDGKLVETILEFDLNDSGE